MTKAERFQVYNKYGGHCAYCGKKIGYKDMQVDHIDPMATEKQIRYYQSLCRQLGQAPEDDFENLDTYETDERT